MDSTELLKALEPNRAPHLNIHFDIKTDEAYLRYGTLIEPTGDFEIKFHSQNPNELNVPVLPAETYQNIGPYSFTYYDEKRQKYHSHKPHAQMVRCRIEYQKLHLVKIVREFGVYILKENEEMYSNPVVIYRQEIYLRYYFRKENGKPMGWVIIADGNEPPEDADGVKIRIQEWIKEQLYIDQLQRSAPVIAATKAFETWNEIPIDQKDGQSYKKTLQQRRKLLEIVYHFYEYEAAFGEITGIHHKLLKKQMIRSLKKCDEIAAFLKQHPHVSIFKKDRFNDDVFTQNEHNACTALFDEQLDSMKQLLLKRGYWILSGNVYPNAGEYLALNRLAENNRTPETKQRLKTCLLEMNKTFIFLSDSNLQQKIEKKKT